MHTLKLVIRRGWSLILVTVISIVSLEMNWPIWVIAPILVIILVVGLTMELRRSKQVQLTTMAEDLRDLTKHFYDTFIERRELSVFNLAQNLHTPSSPEIADWARACDMGGRVLHHWLTRFAARVEADIRIRKEERYLSACVHEFWDINNLYHDFVREFCQKASKEDITKSARESYNKFRVEYNAFVQNFRGYISEFKKVAKIDIKPQSVKFAG